LADAPFYSVADLRRMALSLATPDQLEVAAASTNEGMTVSEYSEGI
jgi:hypothetical protein